MTHARTAAPYVGRALTYPRSPAPSLRPGASCFFRPVPVRIRSPTRTDSRSSCHASRKRHPQEDALREVPGRTCRSCSRDRTWPNVVIDKAPLLVLGRPARRQPGADRPDGPGPQAEDVRRAGEDGLQGDRGRLPVGEPARLRLHPPADRGRPDPRRRAHPGARAVPAGADRAHVRVHRRGAAGDRALLQLDQPAAARGRVRARQGRHQGDRRQRRQAVPQARGDGARDGDPLRVLAGELHAHRARLRDRGVRGGDGRDRADARRPDHPQPAGHRRVLLPQRLRRRDRVVLPHDQEPRVGDRQPPPAQRPRLRGSPPPSSA